MMTSVFGKTAHMAARGAVVSLGAVILAAGAAQGQDDHPLSYYPVITKADLQVCRSEFASSQAEYIATLRADQKRFAASDPQSAADTGKELARISKQDPVSYWADADTDPITRLEHLNEFPESNYDNFKKYVRGLSDNNVPQSEDKNLSPVYWASENCVARMWIAKFNKMHSIAVAPSPKPAGPTPTPSTRPGTTPPPVSSASTGNPNYPVGGAATPFPAGAPGALMRSCQKELQRTGNALSTPQEWPTLWRDNFVSYAERMADMESADVVRSEFKRLITNRNRYSMGTAFVCMMDVRARQLGGTVADLIAAVAPPPMKSAPTPGGSTTPGVGTSVAETRSAPGGVSVSGPDQTGVSTVKSPPITGSASASTGSPQITGGRDRTIPSANYCISMTNSIQRPASAPAMRVHVYRNNCSFELAVFGMREGPAVYHLLWAMKPGESVWDPYATLDDGKPYNKLLSYIACRNDRNYGADSDYERKTVTCKGP